MRQKQTGRPSSSEQIIKAIKRKTRKQYSAEEKIRIVLDGLRGEDSIAELCRREGIAQSLSGAKLYSSCCWQLVNRHRLLVCHEALIC